VLIAGVMTSHDHENGMLLGRNTAYLITMDDVHICHLGDPRRLARALEMLTGADVPLIPVGGRTHRRRRAWRWSRRSRRG
jgi:L-ascorbate metabolism protein UlaG (beta-lactamase superfamily)